MNTLLSSYEHYIKCQLHYVYIFIHFNSIDLMKLKLVGSAFFIIVESSLI